MKSSSKNLIKIAKIIDAKGLRGEVKVLFLSGDVSIIDSLEYLFVMVNGHPQKWNIDKVSSNSKADRVDIKFDHLNDRTAAEKVKGTEFFIEEDALKSNEGEEIFLREILGFEVEDGEMLVGKITGFESNGPQDLLIVVNDAQENFLIPLVKEFTVKIDYKNKKVKMKLPVGLVGLK